MIKRRFIGIPYERLHAVPSTVVESLVKLIRWLILILKHAGKIQTTNTEDSCQVRASFKKQLQYFVRFSLTMGE